MSEVQEKFITTSFTYLCGGLGNQMYRFASLYAIARETGRTPYFDVSVRCMLSSYGEVEELFPKYAQLLRFEV
uniref:Alpha-1,2-fucosyltransferase n=1 Tax=Ditylenchus dipsaci TaxID=166011 RepID=A0A915EU96_9BILA